ncbi:MAG: hypothetical protein NC253_14730 [Ruminococcus sp.]|nr:hypothetical protein [Ruminococcus sp.]MCM1480107.1 hypothetical protein [Muribaculaceae bacterium]
MPTDIIPNPNLKLIQILKGGVYYSSELAKSQEIECPIVTHQYVTKLKNATKLIRYAQKDNCIKFGSEDGMDSFDLNKYLRELSIYRVKDIAQKCKIAQYKDLKKTALIKQILKNEDAELIIYKDILDHREYLRDEEDEVKK